MEEEEKKKERRESERENERKMREGEINKGKNMSLTKRIKK